MPARRTAWLSGIVAVWVMAGCGSGEPNSFRFSGTVKLDGKPIPYGEIILTPDAKQKNNGPQGRATIQDGKFDTAGNGKGFAGGPTVLRVNGMTAAGGKTLCEYEFTLDLPRESSTKDIDVPLKDAHNGNANKGKPAAGEI